MCSEPTFLSSSPFTRALLFQPLLITSPPPPLLRGFILFDSSFFQLPFSFPSPPSLPPSLSPPFSLSPFLSLPPPSLPFSLSLLHPPSPLPGGSILPSY